MPADSHSPTKTSEPRPAAFDIVGMGEISVDDVLFVEKQPEWGGKARVGRRVRIGGGQVATAMVAARRLGLVTALVGRVGDDEPGRFALAGLAAEHVDIRGVLVTSDGPTHAAVIVVDGAGGRTVLWSDDAPGVGEADRGAAPAALFLAGAGGRVAHVDGNHLARACAFARGARAAGRLVSCDLDRYEPPHTDDLLALTDLCIVSPAFLAELEPELASSAGTSDTPALLRRLHARIARGGIACVTLGEHGAAAWDGAHLVEEPAFRGVPIVDTTACGDTFRAAFLSAWLDGADLRRCLRQGNAAAALKLRDVGRLGCPTRDELRAFLADRDPVTPLADRR